MRQQLSLLFERIVFCDALLFIAAILAAPHTWLLKARMIILFGDCPPSPNGVDSRERTILLGDDCSASPQARESHPQ